MREVLGPGLAMKTALRLAVVVFVAAALLNLPWLGSAPLADSTESRHAEVGREFAEGGHWLVPALNYRAHLTKPPLTDWLVAGGILVFGENEFGARFGGALAAALGLALVAGFAARLAGLRAGLAAAFLYFLTPIYLALSRTISIDIVLSVPVVAAFWAAWEAARAEAEGTKRLKAEGCLQPSACGCPQPGSGVRLAALVFWLALAVGVLAKGHIVLLLVVLPVVVWLALGKRLAAARRLCWPPAVLLGLGIALPWFVYIAVRFPGWLTSMLSSELGGRTLGEEYGSAVPGLSIAYVLVGALPCVPLALLPVFGRREEEKSLRSAGTTGLFICGVLVPLAVFSAVRCQRANYVAPLVPAVAILAGVGCTALLESWLRAGRARRAAAYAVPALLGLTALAWIASPFFLSEVDATRFAVMASTGCLAVLAAGLCALALRRSALRLAPALVACLVPALWGQTLAVIGEIKSMRSTRGACRPLLKRPEPWRGVVLYETSPMSAVFYLGGPLVSRGSEVGERTSGRDDVRVGKYPPPWEAQTERDLRGMCRRKGGLRLIARSPDRRGIHRMQIRTYMKACVMAAQGENLLVLVQELPEPPRKSTGRRAPASPLAPGELDVLVKDLRGRKSRRRVGAAERLAELGREAAGAAPALAEALSDPDRRVRISAARALGAVGVKSEVVTGKLTAGLGDIAPGMRSACAKALGDLGVDSPDSIRGMIRLLDDKSTWVRRTALGALSRIAVKSRPEKKIVTEKLLAGLADRSPVVRAEAAKALGRSDLPRQEVAERVLALLSDEDFRPRKSVVELLGRARPVRMENVSLLVRALGDEDWDVRAAAAASLGRIGPAASPAAVPGLVRVAGDRYWRARLNALKSLCSVVPGSQETLSTLRAALKDKTGRVRSVASGLLAAGGRIPDD